MTEKVADFVLARLRDWDVEQVFGYPGDGINGLLAAWERAGDRPRFVQARHEEMSAFEAVGYAKFTGRVGVCAATSGPGAIHLLNGLYDAKLDHVPVVALVGQTARSAMGGSYQQEVDLPALFKDVASDFLQTVTVPEQLPNVLDRALRTAYARQALTAVIIPADVQALDYEPPGHAFTMVPSSLDHSEWTTEPSREALRRAADVLNAGERVALFVGQGAAGARQEVTETAETPATRCAACCRRCGASGAATGRRPSSPTSSAGARRWRGAPGWRPTRSTPSWSPAHSIRCCPRT